MTSAELLERMTFLAYGGAVKSSQRYPASKGILYPLLGIESELGKVCKELQRDSDSLGNMCPQRKARIAKELGDVLWYLVALMLDLGLNPAEVALTNVKTILAQEEKAESV